MRGGAGLVVLPRRLFHERPKNRGIVKGRVQQDLVEVTRELSQSGVRMIGLGALGYDARPFYDKNTAGKLRKVGMDVLVCTPETLAECMGRIIRG